MKKNNNLTAAGMILAGGLMFAGSAGAATLFTEDFESGAGQWQTSWGTYGTASNYSGDLHTTSVTGGGATYGNLIGNAGATSDSAAVVSNTVILAAGDTEYTFSAYLAAYTGNAGADYAQISVEFFSDAGATTSLGVTQLASGDVEGTSTTASGAWNNVNWSEYTATGTVAAGAQSFQVIYGGPGNDAYADNINFSVTTAAVPEPSSAALIGLGGLTLILRRRK